MRDLTALQQKFINNVMDGMTQSEAYRKAGYKVDGLTPQGVAERACRLAKTQAIAKYLDAGRKHLEKKAIWKREQSLEKLARLADGALQSALTRVDGKLVFNHQAATVAIRAIDQANKICGYQDEETPDRGEAITVEMGDMEKYAK